MTKKTSFEDACILNAVRFLRFCARLSPLAAAVAVGRVFGLAAYGLSKRRHVARRNLRAAFAETRGPREIRRLARRSFENLGASLGEMLKIPDLGPSYVEKHLSIEGREKFEERSASGEGAIFLTAHFGSWELLNITAGILGHPLTVLARVQKHPRSDEFLNELRASKGATVVFKGMMLRQLVRALKSGNIVAMLIDQDGGRRGTFVDLFGRRSSTPSGAAEFAKGTGKPVFSVFIRRTNGLDHKIVVEGPFDAPPAGLDEAAANRFLLQQFTDKLERIVREAPDQWLWAHRRWKSTPDRWVAVLTDGKAGHEKQSEAVLESIRRERAAAGFPADSLHVKRIRLDWKSRRRLSILKAFGWLTGRTPMRLLEWALMPEAARMLFSTYADVVISCGSSLLDAHLWLKRENDARSVVVMKPHRALGEFEAVLAPKHDRIAGRPNVFRTDGAAALSDPEAARRSGEALARELNLGSSGAPVLSLYLGGDAGDFRYDEAGLRAFLADIRALAEGLRADLLVTTSRRTPSWAEAMARETFEKSPALRLLVLANVENRPGVVEAMAAAGSAHFVSGESVSMISEIMAAGRPVWTFFPGKRAGIKKKYRQFLDALSREGRVREWGGGSERMRRDVSEALGRTPAASGAASNIPAEAIRRVIR